MYVESKDKETLSQIGEIRFVRAQDVLELIYASKSGNTQLRWRKTKEGGGRLTGKASLNSLVNLVAAKILDSTDDKRARS